MFARLYIVLETEFDTFRNYSILCIMIPKVCIYIVNSLSAILTLISHHKCCAYFYLYLENYALFEAKDLHKKIHESRKVLILRQIMLPQVVHITIHSKTLWVELHFHRWSPPYTRQRILCIRYLRNNFKR